MLKSRNKPMVFTYLYDNGSSFQCFRNDDLSKIDVINLSFGIIVDGKVSVKSVPNIKEIINCAHNEGKRVVLAIGGWGVNGFSDAVFDSDSRKVFIDSIIDTVKKYNLDGIDIDWEYPGSSAGGNKFRETDKVNLTLFMKELRFRFNELNNDLILSIAVANGEWAASKYYEVKNLNDYIDYLHLMSYDIIDFPTEANPNVRITHHTNLYDSKYSTSSAHSGVKAYIKYGISKEKIVLGIAFYAHVFETNEVTEIGLNATSNKDKKRTMSYRMLKNEILNNPKYKLHYDSIAHANWVFGNNTVYSFDSEESIKSKCDYIKCNDLGGVMVWEYCKDDENSSLLNAINNNIRG